ncbi:hypothetical protein RhiirA4_428939 [Rhizophagus irregularis]|uniref:Uncharacterized protein n=1 Tax=Rhizophagus irregularis TaxID=588596 RepID=A0A2I1HEQ6_9GLOM|nr:hypothetical protein RhiirA4_428939 [Rhizophagus irregularis]
MALSIIQVVPTKGGYQSFGFGLRTLTSQTLVGFLDVRVFFCRSASWYVGWECEFVLCVGSFFFAGIGWFWLWVLDLVSVPLSGSSLDFYTCMSHEATLFIF